MMAEDERDRTGPEQGRERRDRKSTLRRKKKRDRSGTKDRGNKPDGEFEGDEVNGDRRRMDEEEAARQAGELTREARVVHKRDGSGTEEEKGEAIGVEKFNCAYFRSDVSQILRPSPRVLHIQPLPRLQHSPPLSPSAFAQQSVSAFILHPSFFACRNGGKLVTYT